MLQNPGLSDVNLLRCVIFYQASDTACRIEILSKLSNNKLMLKVDSAEHQDFCCLPFIVRTSGNCKNTPFFTTITKLAISFLDEHLKKSNSFSQTLEQEMNKTVRQK